MKLYLQTSDYRSIEISIVETTEEATQIVKDLESQFEEWEKNGFPKHPFPPVLRNWEGGDVYLSDDDKTWMFTDFGWQEFFRSKGDSDGR